VAAHLNRAFPWNDETQQYLTLLYGTLDRVTGEFRFTAAGHPGPVVLPRGGTARQEDVPGFAIGLGDGPYEETSLVLRAGDRLYLYSDGLPDALNAEAHRLGKERMLGLLQRGRDLPLQEGVATLLRGVQDWCGRASPHDDISVLALERTDTEGQ
jgi:sigma-B regulation protein RsbU (phosphoserine phosphatase)